MATRVGVGTGSLSRGDQGAITREWLATAAGPAVGPAGSRPAAPPAATLGAMGIGVRRVPRKAKA